MKALVLHLLIDNLFLVFKVWFKYPTLVLQTPSIIVRINLMQVPSRILDKFLFNLPKLIHDSWIVNNSPSFDCWIFNNRCLLWWTSLNNSLNIWMFSQVIWRMQWVTLQHWQCHRWSYVLSCIEFIICTVTLQVHLDPLKKTALRGVKNLLSCLMSYVVSCLSSEHLTFLQIWGGSNTCS